MLEKIIHMPVRDGLAGHGANDVRGAKTTVGIQNLAHEGQDRLADEQADVGDIQFLGPADDEGRILLRRLVGDGAQIGALGGTEDAGHEGKTIPPETVENVLGGAGGKRGGEARGGCHDGGGRERGEPHPLLEKVLEAS